MTNTQVKLQVPLSIQLRDNTQKKAAQYGFGSLQELVRFMLVQFDTGAIKPTIATQEDDYDRLLTYNPRLQRLAKESVELRRQGKTFVANSIQELREQLESDEE